MIRKLKLAALSALSFASVLQAIPTQAATYTSQASFDAATTGLTVIDFNTIAAPGSYVDYGNGPAVFGPATLTSNGTIFVIDPGYYGSSYPDGFLSSDYAPGGTDVVLASLASPSTALGFDFGGLLAAPVTISFMLSNGESYSASSSNSIKGTNTLDFFGVTSTVPFTSVTFDLPDSPNYTALDNLTFASSAAAVPELSTWAMMLVGFGMVGFAMRSRHKQAVRVTYA